MLGKSVESGGPRHTGSPSDRIPPLLSQRQSAPGDDTAAGRQTDKQHHRLCGLPLPGLCCVRGCVFAGVCLCLLGCVCSWVSVCLCVCVCVCAEDDQEIILRDDSQKTNGPICLGISVASTKTRLMQSLLCTSGGGGGGGW